MRWTLWAEAFHSSSFLGFLLLFFWSQMRKNTDFFIISFSLHWFCYCLAFCISIISVYSKLWYLLNLCSQRFWILSLVLVISSCFAFCNKFCGYNFCVAGLHKLSLLNLEGCPVTAACLESLSGFYSVQVLGFSASQCILIPIQIWYCCRSRISIWSIHTLSEYKCVYTTN